MRTSLKIAALSVGLAIGASYYGLRVVNDALRFELNPAPMLAAAKTSYFTNLHLSLAEATAFYENTGLTPPQNIMRIGYDRGQFAKFAAQGPVIQATVRQCVAPRRPPIAAHALYKGRPADQSNLLPHPMDEAAWAKAPGQPVQVLRFFTDRGINGPGRTSALTFSGLFGLFSSTVLPPADDTPPVDVSDCALMPEATALLPGTLKAVSSLPPGGRGIGAHGLTWEHVPHPVSSAGYAVRTVANTAMEEETLRLRATRFSEELAKGAPAWLFLERDLVKSPTDTEVLVRTDNYRYQDGTSLEVALERQAGKLTLTVARMQ